MMKFAVGFYTGLVYLFDLLGFIDETGGRDSVLLLRPTSGRPLWDGDVLHGSLVALRLRNHDRRGYTDGDASLA